MSEEFAARRARFRALHEAGCFILPNPWDVGSAHRLERMGFKALASTSAGAAWALGREDGELSCAEVLAHLRVLVAATSLPVNADFEAGFADAPDEVAANVGLAVETGVAGISIEDRTGTTLYDLSLAVERIRASREAIDLVAPDVLLIGRTEGYLIGRTTLGPTLERLVAYAKAGAGCVYAPGIKDLGAIRELVAEVAPVPVNVLHRPGLTVADLAAAGARRVSVGASLAAASWAGFTAAATALVKEGEALP
ncbi:MAG TPA: isocitrate lyase/phosphoenolpyruvate mutase family protein [Acetobacteraceae bacterium]|nr:isocitrate lyase/phosphoenolpyruvate mutase family protein [Acetobacteraceae bacterium]